MNKYEEMIERADKRFNYSELERQKILSLLEYCHANDVRMTHRRMYEVFFLCDAMPGMELTTCTCDSECERCGCSNYTAAEDAELLINQEKSILDFEPSDDFFFAEEVKSMIKRYQGKKKGKISDGEIEMIIKEIQKELKCFNHCLGEGGI